MSAEGKKKRGEAGASNAKTVPFRYGGSKCNISTSIGRAERCDKARFLSAMALGAMVQRAFGFKMQASERMYKWADEAMEVCTVERPF